MSAESFEMDPEEILDYEIDWQRVLAAGEEVASAVWEVDGNATLGVDDYAPTATATTSKVWVEGSAVDEVSTITCTMTTDATPPRIFRKSFSVTMVTR